MKIRSAGAELFLAHGQTAVTKITVAFSIFANAPQNRKKLRIILVAHKIYVNYNSQRDQEIGVLKYEAKSLGV